MNLVLLLPAALVALAALALPLLLHLARRQQQLPTMFAALRWLRAKPKPRRRIRFDEWPLLAVRLLLVALLALWLARPALDGVEDARPRLLVAPDAGAEAIAAARAEGEVDARWLAPGFPALEQPAPQDVPVTASLLRDFDDTLAPEAPLAVLVPTRLHGADGGRLRLSREVDWRIVSGAQDVPDAATIRAPVLAIRHDEAHRDGVRYLRAAAQSWRADEASVDIQVTDEADAPLADEATVLAWLRADPLPQALLHWVERGGQALLAVDAEPPTSFDGTVLWRDDAGAPLLAASALGQGRVLRFEQALEPHAMPQLLDGSFAHRLRDVLQPPPAPTLVAAED
ncbi:MAG TPA: BatA domain-containing protein, partial [Luteimonas sp.]|nr:BatA domain-containing protein [Luteimonas sp.]